MDVPTLAWRSLLILIVALSAAFALWMLLFPTPSFWVPTGPHAIGTRVYELTDPSRPEPFAEVRGHRRHLSARLWYPAEPSGHVLPYVQRPEVLAAIASRLHVPPFLLSRLGNAPTHAIAEARPRPGPFPVLLNPTGFSGFHTANLYWIEELVS
jgi:hypothetical protein